MHLFTVTAFFAGLPNVTKRVLARSQFHACEIVAAECRLIRPTVIAAHAEAGQRGALLDPATGEYASVSGYLATPE